MEPESGTSERGMKGVLEFEYSILMSIHSSIAVKRPSIFTPMASILLPKDLHIFPAARMQASISFMLLIMNKVGYSLQMRNEKK